MGKMMSLLEKYKLIEKEDTQMISDNTSKLSTHEDFSDQVAGTADFALQEDFFDSYSIKEAVHVELPNSAPIQSNEEDTTPSSRQVAYNHLMKIEEIYHHLNIGEVAVTDSVFLLENLINALPEDLPDFVKKTTIHNIIKASAMDLPRLLEDGRIRSNYLRQFSKDFTATNEAEISSLKSEITRLSAIISSYQQQIKHMESLISDEKSIVQVEQNRIESILEFFGH